MAKPRTVSARIIKAQQSMEKTTGSTAVNMVLTASGDDFITPPTDLKGYKQLVNNSTILPQCIRAYKNNIAGFGIGIRYKEDVDETAAMKTEWNKIAEVVENLSLDRDIKEVFEDVIEARETYGIAYLEIIRNLSGEITGVEFIKNIPSIQKTSPLDPYIDIEYMSHDKSMKRPKRFCKYRQQLAGKTVYFKELGDPRMMDRSNGRYGDDMPPERQANELLEFVIGSADYGEVRWMGQVLGVDGSRKAESLNNRYFQEGRHTPLMILIKGGTLTDESFAKLQTYVNDIKGENGQHAFIVLEAENLDSRTDIEGEKPPELEIVKMADILQKDELFQDYLDNNRRKVQSAFQLPDLYVGYTTDFNRATAQTAQEVTEKQVFQPERQSLAWIINNKLLAEYRFIYVEVYFQKPEITNPDDFVKILNVAERAGGLTPNMAKAIAFEAYGKTAEPYEDDWAEIPLAFAKLSQTAMGDAADVPAIGIQLARQIKKAAEQDDAEITAVLKEVRNLLADSDIASVQ